MKQTKQEGTVPRAVGAPLWKEKASSEVSAGTGKEWLLVAEW